MPNTPTLIRSYLTQHAYEHDAQKLARLGYVVLAVVEQPPAVRWWQRLWAYLGGAAPPRLRVSYRDQGTAPARAADGNHAPARSH